MRKGIECMEPDKIEKRIKEAKIVGIIFFILNLIILIFFIVLNQMTPALLFFRCATLTIIVGSILGYYQRKTFGPICGIIVSILLILSFGILDVILGVCYLVDNITLLKYIKN